VKRLLLVFSLLLLLVQPLANPLAAQDTTSQNTATRDANWREDLQFLWAKIQQMHPDPYRVTSQADFEQMVSDLDAQIPDLTDDQIVVGLLKMIAALRDGHSWIGLTQNPYPFHYYPLFFYPFSDGLVLIEAAPAYADAIGSRLVRIGSMDVAQVIETLQPLEPRDNDFSGLITLPMLIAMKDVLLGTGIISDADQPGYVLEQPDGTQITLNPAPVSQSVYNDAVPVPHRLPQQDVLLSRSRLDEAFWWTYLDDQQTIYFQYNQVINQSAGKTISTLSQDLETALTAHPLRHLILDLRYNSGGDTHTATPLRNFFSDNAFFKTPGDLIVLIGRNTFSAGVVFSLWLEHDVQPIFMGEPTGGRPLMFENAREITLPNSQLLGQVATHARNDFAANDQRQAVAPQIEIALSSAEYFSAADPVLDAALAYTAPS